jgi:RNA polymerase sigma-70 factor (ECF subfamily)
MGCRVACMELAEDSLYCESSSAGRSIFEGVDQASSEPGELTLTLPSAGDDASAFDLPPALLEELWRASEAATCGLTKSKFSDVLVMVGIRHQYNQPSETHPTLAQQTAFYRTLRLPELALAHACALGHESAWQRFFNLYRAPLTEAAVAVTGSATLGHDLADSLYAQLFGLTAPSGERRSPLATYSGRGSLLSWLRSILVQRHIDHHRRTHREIPLEGIEGSETDAAPASVTTPLPAELDRLTHAVACTLEALATEDRFLLTAYFLDEQTMLQIAQLLHVHEGTVSRRLKRLTADLRKQLLHYLQAGGLSELAAEEALGVDPRDLEVNLRALLQSSEPQPIVDPTPSSKHVATLNQHPATR